MFRECALSIPQKIYLRIYGAGPAIVLFHPSPNSSKMMHALASELSTHFTVICPDTPGYGLSEKLNIQNPTMTDFVHSFFTAFQQLGIKDLAIYGSATGGQLAIRYGLEYPDQVNCLFLDNCAHFTDQERQDIFQSYFPDLTPVQDGGHLIKLWDMVSHLFLYFPWCFKDESHKLKTPAPPIEVLHSIAMEYVQAGKDYDLAYKAAFNHEKVEHIQALTVPATIFRWQGSILKSYTDRLFEYEQPPHITQADISADRALRFSEMTRYIQKHYVSNQPQHVISSSPQSGESAAEVYESPPGLGVPPKPEPSGNYLIKAWNRLVEFDKKNNIQLSLHKINHQLNDWYSNHS